MFPQIVCTRRGIVTLVWLFKNHFPIFFPQKNWPFSFTASFCISSSPSSAASTSTATSSPTSHRRETRNPAGFDSKSKIKIKNKSQYKKVYCNILSYFTQKRNSQSSRSELILILLFLCSYSNTIYYSQTMYYSQTVYYSHTTILLVLFSYYVFWLLFSIVLFLVWSLRSQVVARRLAERARQRHTRSD